MQESTGDRDKNANLARQPELNKITLNDGKEYELEPMNINILVSAEDKFNKPFPQIMDDAQKGYIRVIRYLLWMRIKNKYPEVDTEEKLGSMLDLDVMLNLANVFGVK